MHKQASSTMGKKRIVIIGLDGVPFGLLNRLSRQGIMSETSNLISGGYFQQMESSIPEISSVAWSSIITGKNPGEHGIFGYTEIPVDTYRLSFPSFSDLMAQPFWQIYAKKKSIIINVPSTYPVKPMNGIHVSGFVSLDFKKSVYPDSLIPKLRSLEYEIDVNVSNAHESTVLFLKDLDKTLTARIRAYRSLWEEEDWTFFMLVFTGTDRLSHFLWDAYEDASHPFHPAFLAHFRQIDAVIGEIAGRLTDQDLFILLSDHGFERLQQEVNINFFLKEQGFLRLKPDSKRGYADIETGTKAFALDPARIYVNMENKYPKGSVKKSDYDRAVKDLTDLFCSLTSNGQKVIHHVHLKQEIYRGPCLDRAPDIVLLPNAHFGLKAGLKATQPFEKNIFTGKHTQKDAFLLVSPPEYAELITGQPSVTDIIRIIHEFL